MWLTNRYSSGDRGSREVGSGDENQPTGDAFFLNGNQLLGSAALKFNTPPSWVTGSDEEQLGNKNNYK